MVEIFKSQYEEIFLKRIAPIQQEKVYEIYQKFPNIAARVIIFGSSTTSACNRYSDVDVLVIVPDKNSAREKLSEFLLALDFDIDILFWSIEELKENLNKGSNIIKSIRRSGVKIYDRDVAIS